MSNIPECDVCEKPMKPDITGEYRCSSCDEAIDSMMMDEWEEAVCNGLLDNREDFLD